MTPSNTEGQEPISSVYQNESIIIFRCEDLFYPEYKGKFFVLEKSEGYEYFKDIYEIYTKRQILDEFGVNIQSSKQTPKP